MPVPPTSRPPLPIKRVTLAEQEARRAKGLCFYCDEKFFRGHHCKAKQFLLLMADEDDSEPDPANLYFLNQPDPPLPTSILPTNPPANNSITFPTTNPENFHPSMQAINGQPSPKTFRFAASILGHTVSVLIDSGSSHNIIQSRVATFLNIPTAAIGAFKVMVGHGDYLECVGFCSTIPLQIQSYIFNVSFYVFPIQGADVVLGIQWLQSIGPFIADFTIPNMQFYY